MGRTHGRNGPWSRPASLLREAPSTSCQISTRFAATLRGRLAISTARPEAGAIEGIISVGWLSNCRSCIAPKDTQGGISMARVHLSNIKPIDA